MSDHGAGRHGTRFRLYPQAPFLHPDRLPECVTVSSPAGAIVPGPADGRMYLIDPVAKARPYGVQVGSPFHPSIALPPWEGWVHRPVYPDCDGHFDHIPVGTPEFERAHVFGCIRFVMDIWEHYLGSPIEWHFSRDLDRLEIVMLPSLDNAHVGYGFMEVGAAHLPGGVVEPFALNFDVIAHEFGHLILYSVVGVPEPETESAEYLGFQEAGADMTALISVLHFDSMLNELLEETHGNLYTFNELARFSELSVGTQIRLAANSVKLSAFAAGWDDEHELSQPLTGALFDILVDVFQEHLVERGLISPEIAEMARGVARCPENEDTIHAAFRLAYAASGEGFSEALRQARDYLGLAFADTWKRLSPRHLDYADVADILLAVDRALSGGRFRRAIVESFQWREIGTVRIGPRTTPPDERSHAFSARTLLPEHRCGLAKMRYGKQRRATSVG